MIQPTTTSAQFQGAYRRLRSSFLVEIKSSDAVSGANYRWKYSVQPVYLTGTFTDPVFNTRGDEINAMNIRELGDSSTDVQGIDPEDLPGGFSFGAVVGYVLAWPGTVMGISSTDTPETIALFDAPNPLTGACES